MSDDLERARYEELGRRAVRSDTDEERQEWEAQQAALKNAGKLTDLEDSDKSGDNGN